MAALWCSVMLAVCLVLQCRASGSASSNDVEDFKCARVASDKFVSSIGQFFNNVAREVNKKFDVVQFAKEQGFVDAAFYNAGKNRYQLQDVFRNMFRSFRYAQHVFERCHEVRGVVAKQAAVNFKQDSGAMDAFFKCAGRNVIKV